MDSQYPVRFIKIDPLTLELLPLSLSKDNYNAKPILAFLCNYLHISSKLLYLTTFHCPVPVEKHDSFKILPPKGSKVKYLNFPITKAVVNIFC